ncbi:MAG: cbb3-type cytochrome c oxidase subunit 3 [Alphaproteobacteria bacterium]|nr:MAG: cbb3-type cytochrome c oxidase subunit 3 [Alphaproteobacteria bacterium]
MKALYASADYGLIGLIFFFLVFVGIALWVYQPQRKQSIEASLTRRVMNGMGLRN